MFKKFLSLILAGTMLSGFPVFAAEEKVEEGQEINEPGNIFEGMTEPTTLKNDGSITSTDGHIFYLNTNGSPYINLSDSSVHNSGQMNTNGQGFSVYADPLENQRMTTTVINSGNLDRINLYKTDSSQVTNQAQGNLYGSVLMGTNAHVLNYGTMQNWQDSQGNESDSSGKPYDFNPDFKETPFASNSLWFDRRAKFQNGLNLLSVGSIFTNFNQEASVLTDNIFFHMTGDLNSAGLIDNKFIGTSDSYEEKNLNGTTTKLVSNIHLINTPFYEIDTPNTASEKGLFNHVTYNNNATMDEFEYQDKKSRLRHIVIAYDSVMAENNRAELNTEKMSLGKDTLLSVDMGSKVSVNDLATADSVNIEFGRDYYLSEFLENNEDLQAKMAINVAVEHLDEDGNKTYETEQREFNVIPHRTEVSLGTVSLGNDNRLILSNMTDVEGIVSTQTNADGSTVKTAPSMALGNNNTLSVTGGSLNLSGSANVKAANNMTYFAESRKPQDEEFTAYERRNLSFISFGEDAGKLQLNDSDSTGLWSANPTIIRSDYGNNYLGYIKDYLGFIKNLKAPEQITDFANFKDSVVSFGDNGILSLNAYSRTEQIALTLDKAILEDAATKDDEIYVRFVLPVNEEEQAIFMTKKLSMEKGNSQILLNGGIVSVKDIKLGDNATISGTNNSQNALFADTITFGNNGKYETAEDFEKTVAYINDEELKTVVPSMTTLLSGNMIFGDNGHFANKSAFKANKLVMGKNATVDVWDNLWTETWVDSNSKINIQPVSQKGILNGISNGLFKKEGATNVEVFSNAQNLNSTHDSRRIYNENYLLNGVNVDKIHVQSGGLLMGSFDPEDAKGDIHGNILMSNDTWIHFVGNNIKVYDPIARENGATNTLVWFDLEDNAKYDTLNTIDSDNILIAGGVLNVYHTITAPTITLDTAGSLRIYDNQFVKSNIVEYESSAPNTTLFLKPRVEKIDSFGIIDLDRVILENGTFNTYHTIFARAKNDGSPEGIWMGSNSTINIHSNVHASHIIRREDRIEGVTFPIVNTTAIVDGGNLTIDSSADIDTLDIKSGTFTFKNTSNNISNTFKRDISITNDVSVGSAATFWANGSSDSNSGRIIIGNGNGVLNIQGAHFGLTSEHLDNTDTTGVMNLSANLSIGDDSIIDLRTNENGSDLIHATGRIDLHGKTRLFIRDLQEKTTYKLMTADNGLSLPDVFDVSFRWHGTNINTPDGKNLYLSIDNISTLKEELEQGSLSQNITKIGSYISDTWDGSYGAWDDIFFATTLDKAVEKISEYMPEGYINAPQTTLRTASNFQSMAIGELDDMRQLSSVKGKGSPVRRTYKRPTYYSRGRSGGDMYRPYVRASRQTSSAGSVFNSANRPTYRTDKGGLWAKPFYLSMTQDADKGISGYEYDSYGLAAGIDKRFGRWTWGLSGLYATGDYETDNGVIKADTNTWGVGLYGSYRPNHSPFFMNLFASYVLNNNEAKHDIKTANARLKADYDTDALSAGFAFGYDIALAKSFYITPKIGFNYSRLTTDEIKEEGIAPLIMKIKNPDINSLQLPVEIRLAFPISARRFELLPEFHFRYTHDFGDTDYTSKAYINGTDTEFKLDSIAMPENLFTLGGSLGFTAGAHELSGRYEYDFGNGLNSHLFNLGYKYLF